MEKVKKFMLCLFAMIFAFISSLTGQSGDDSYRSELFQVQEAPSVQIETSGGSIQVTGHSENEVRVDMIVRRGSRILSPSDTDLSDFDIEISKDGNSVLASAKRKSSATGGWFGSRNNISISFVVHTPETSIVNGRTSGGSVEAKNLANTLSLRTSGGSVKAERIHADADLRTSGGTITLNDIHGNISARTSGGSIRVNNLTGPADLRTSGGSINLEEARGSISARTSGGSIRAKLSEFSDDLDFRTSGGSINIDIPTSDHFELDLTGSRVNVDLRNFTGRSERNRVSGTIGDGGPKISARTSGGSVNLNYN